VLLAVVLQATKQAGSRMAEKQSVHSERHYEGKGSFHAGSNSFVQDGTAGGLRELPAWQEVARTPLSAI
jgi:hypothetical protein